jgi:hypothetical protein
MKLSNAKWYVGEMDVDKVPRYACHCFLGTHEVTSWNKVLEKLRVGHLIKKYLLVMEHKVLLPVDLGFHNCNCRDYYLLVTCNVVEVNRRFRGTYYLHLQD